MTAPTPAEPSQPEAPMPDEAAWNADGSATDLGAVVARFLADNADVVVFGELHGHEVGAAWEMGLLEGLAAGDRPVALAMEFLERDVQPAVDAWLAGEMDDAAFIKAARQGPAYATTHGPLLAFAKEHGLPVVAANAPRPLVTRFRKAEDAYEAWLETLEPEERATLPRTCVQLDDAYRAKFVEFMGPQRGPTFFRAQSLWDDAMAEAMADFRAAHPDHRVLFVVGAFHVTDGMGTITKYKSRRPQDVVRSVVMDHAESTRTAPAPEARTRGDVLLDVPAPRRAHGKAS